jgi:hypothetical protein
MPEDQLRIKEQALAVLGGPDRVKLLAKLASCLALSARGEYVEAGNDGLHAGSALRAINELMIVITKQMASSLSENPAYPDDAFLAVLADKSKIGHVEVVLGWALVEALK